MDVDFTVVLRGYDIAAVDGVVQLRSRHPPLLCGPHGRGLILPILASADRHGAKCRVATFTT